MRSRPYPRCWLWAASLAMALGVRGESVRQYTNPIMRGDWSDPGVIRVGDDYYTCRSSFGWQPGIPIAHSRDLVHWEYVGHAFQTLDVLRPGDTRGGIWGVEMGYNPNTKQYLIYAPTRDYEVFVFAADRPEGPYAMSKLGGNLGIDPGFFADDDGRLYLVLNRGIIYELSRDGRRIERQVTQVDRRKHRYFEGPDIFKHNGWYYLLFSDGGTLPHQPSTISTLRARTLAGPWEEDPANPVMFSTDNGAKFEGPAHGTLIETQRGEWYVTYHAHETAFYSLGREMCMEPVEWTEDGWWRPVGGRIPSERNRAPDLPTYAVLPAQSDDFSAPGLGRQWFFTCAPDWTGKIWSLVERPGWLRIHAPAGDLGSTAALPAVFQQRVIDKAFTVETCVAFEHGPDGAAAGLHLFHDPGMNVWIAVAYAHGERRVELGSYVAGERRELASAALPPSGTVDLRFSVDGAESATFAWCVEGQPWTPLGGAVYFGASGGHLRAGRRGEPDLGWVGRYKDKAAPAALTQRRPGGNVWTGATFGVFAIRGTGLPDAQADFDYVHVRSP